MLVAYRLAGLSALETVKSWTPVIHFTFSGGTGAGREACGAGGTEDWVTTVCVPVESTLVVTVVSMIPV
jgi:hypothetical protein